MIYNIVVEIFKSIKGVCSMRIMSLAFSLIKYPYIYKKADKIHFKKPPN